MFLALKELRRAKVRFGMLIVTIALLVFLILFQQSLRDALITTFVGGIRNQDAPVLVYSTDGLRSIPASLIVPPVEHQIRAADGVGQAGRVFQRLVTVTAGGADVRATLVGTETAGLGSPGRVANGRLAEGPGEVVASEEDAPDGFAIGDTITVGNGPGAVELKVVGSTPDVDQFGATLYMDPATFTATTKALNPDAAGVLPNVIAVQPAAGFTAEQTIKSINGISEDVDALTKQQAADNTPGVPAVSRSFQLIFLLYGLVVPLICGLFFLIITFQKANSLTLLRAIGAPPGRLVRSLLGQVVIVMVSGLAIGVALFSPLSRQRLGSLALRFDTGTVVFWSVLLLSLALLAALVSARRVLAIDPVEATTGAGVGR